MKVALLIILIVGAHGFRKKRSRVEQNSNNGVEVAEKASATVRRAQCPENRHNSMKTNECTDGNTGDLLPECSGQPCETCCEPDPCEGKEIGDVCQLHEDDIPTKSFLQQEEVKDGVVVNVTSQVANSASLSQRSAECAAVPLAKHRWNHPSFSQCGFWGDPHYTSAFFNRHARFDLMGQGVFQVASSKDKSFEVQSFQCWWNRSPYATVAVGFAVKMDGKTAFNFGKSETFISDDKCFRFDVRVRHTRPTPGHYEDMSLAMKSDLASSEGTCGRASHNNPDPFRVSCGAEHLFTQEQITEMCKVCTDPKPPDCLQPCVKPTPAPPPPPPPPCEVQEEAEKACCALEDDAEFAACVLDYCATGSKDGEAMADDAVNEVMHEVHTCQLDDGKKKCKPKQKPPPTGRCHRMGFQ